MTRFSLYAGGVLLVLSASVVALAQGPSAPPPCDEKLDNVTWNYGESLKESAVLRVQLRAMTKERDDAKAALAKAAPKPEEKK